MEGMLLANKQVELILVKKQEELERVYEIGSGRG